MEQNYVTVTLCIFWLFPLTADTLVLHPPILTQMGPNAICFRSVHACGRACADRVAADF